MYIYNNIVRSSNEMPSQVKSFEYLRCVISNNNLNFPFYRHFSISPTKRTPSYDCYCLSHLSYVHSRPESNLHWKYSRKMIYLRRLHPPLLMSILMLQFFIHIAVPIEHTIGDVFSSGRLTFQFVHFDSLNS